MKDIKAIFFDLYETLIYLPIDTIPYKQFYSACGITDKAAQREFDDITFRKDLLSFQAVADELGIECSGQAQELTKILNYEISQARIYGDAIVALKEIKKLGIPMGLISNLVSPYKRPVYDLGIDSFFDKIIFSCEVGCRKPEKEIYLLACQEMNIEPEQGLMVGDTVISDYEGPLAAGMNAVLINRSSYKLNIPNISSLTELLPIVFEK